MRFSITEAYLVPVGVVVMLGIGETVKSVNSVPVTCAAMSDQFTVGYLGSPASACAVTCAPAK